MTGDHRAATRLREAGDAMAVGDVGAVAVGFEALVARDLVALDARARGWTRPLGLPDAWWRAVDRGAPVPVVVLASLHHEGHLRQRAVERLAGERDRLASWAVALRASDHVDQVQVVALRALLARTGLDEAPDVLAMLLATSGRRRGWTALGQYLDAARARHGERAFWSALRSATDAAVRREALRRELDAGALTADEASRLLVDEGDAVVQHLLVRLLAETGSVDEVRALLVSGTALARVLALVRLDADQVPVDDLRRLVADRSELVRVWARRRADEAGLDPVALCRELVRPDVRPALREQAYRGLAEAGGAVGRTEVLALVASPVPALQRAGLRLLRNQVVADDVPMLLDLVATGTARSARLAGEVLTDRLGLWGVEDVEPLWRSDSAQVRARAWALQRRRGGWETTLADLRAWDERDRGAPPGLTEPVPPQFGNPTDGQRERLVLLLRRSPIASQARHAIAFASRLLDLVPGSTRPGPPGLERAVADLAAGRPRLARERLKSLVTARPTDLELRRLLAEAYRADGQPTEAGRWGLLEAEAATDAERAAFVEHARYGPGRRLGAARLRWLLRSEDPWALADATGRRWLDAETLIPRGRWRRLLRRAPRSVR